MGGHPSATTEYQRNASPPDAAAAAIAAAAACLPVSLLEGHPASVMTYEL